VVTSVDWFLVFFGETIQYRNKQEIGKQSQDPLTSAEAIGGAAAAAILKDISIDVSMRTKAAMAFYFSLACGSGMQWANNKHCE
jgi:hypothetical protein